MSTIYLVSCVDQKSDERSAAKDLYISPWFVKARRYVEQIGGPWRILSAEYGLVKPEQSIKPYEKTLNTLPVADRRLWAARVLEQLTKAVPDLDQVVFLAGRPYREFLTDLLEERGIQVEVPMQGLGIGQQLKWLDDKNGA